MNTRKDKPEVRIGDQRRTHLSDTLEFFSEHVQEELMTITDLSIALERERLRLDHLKSDHKIAVEEVRVTYALLTVLGDKLARLHKEVDKVEEIFGGVLLENGLNPIIAETWARSNS
jgi:hypothetical protein